MLIIFSVFFIFVIWIILIVFLSLGVAWISRPFLGNKWWEKKSDNSISISGAPGCIGCMGSTVIIILLIAIFPLSGFRDFLETKTNFSFSGLHDLLQLRFEDTPPNDTERYTQVVALQNTLENVDALSLREIKIGLSNAVTTLTGLQIEAETRNLALAQVRRTIDNEKTKLQQTQKLRQSIDALTEGQIDAVGSILTERSEQKSQKSFWIGSAISFPVGIAASLIASWLLGCKKKIRIRPKWNNKPT